MPTVDIGIAPKFSQLQAGLGQIDAGTEVRGTATTLYTKGTFTDFNMDKPVREQRQALARATIAQSVDKEFDKMNPVFLAAVKKNVADVLDGAGALTGAQVNRLGAEVARVQGVRNTFNESQRPALLENAHFKAGQAAFREVLAQIPQAQRPTDQFAAFERFAAIVKSAGTNPLSPAQQRELGALQGLIVDLKAQENDLKTFQDATKALQLAAESGATSAMMLPQGLALSQIGGPNDQDGRCVPLVALAAMAEAGAERGADGLIHRLGQEIEGAQAKGVRGITPYSQALDKMHGTGVLSGNSKQVQMPRMGHRDVVAHLAESAGAKAGKPVFYSMDVQAHVMLVGVTSHGGKPSFTFYDPNFGIVRFDSAQKLTDYLDTYFGNDLGYGDKYKMPDGAGGREMQIVKAVDAAAIALLSTTGEGRDPVTLASMVGPK